MLKPDIAALPEEALRRVVEGLCLPAYRAGQVFAWLHRAKARSFDEMTNLPATLRAKLAEGWDIAFGRTAKVQRAADGTAKLLVALRDESCVETVLMQYKHGPSVCVSSQVGCRMGCRFCASSVGAGAGLVRGLTAGEMASQLYLAQEEAGQRVKHLVLMGIGEPLDNYDSVIDFLNIVTSEAGQGLSWRNVSLSTCGLVPGIRRLAGEKLGLTLSVSLHAADDETRARLMPVARSWPLAELMAACRDYQKATGRRVSYEYALFAGVNDGEADAARLAALLGGQGAHLNLISANPVAGSGFSPSPRLAHFAESLNRAGVKTTVRRRLGAGIDAACGQLRMRAAAGASTHSTAREDRE